LLTPFPNDIPEEKLEDALPFKGMAKGLLAPLAETLEDVAAPETNFGTPSVVAEVESEGRLEFW